MNTPCSNNPEEVIAKIVSAKANADKLNQFVNGGPYETVDLGGTATPSVRNVVRQVMADSSWAKDFIADAPEGDVSLNNATAVGSTGSRILADRFADFVNVKDFGAKGDGATDDSDAIQAALNNAVCATVFFPKGTYNISKTLYVNGDTNGAYVFLGESRLVWVGSDQYDVEDYKSMAAEQLPSGKSYSDLHAYVKYNIENYGAAYFGTCMMSVRRVGGAVAGTRCVIEGGVFEGDGVVDVAIKSSAFHTLIHGVRVENVRKIGISLSGSGIDGAGGAYFSDGTGSVSPMLSHQAMISDSFLCQYKNELNRSIGDTIGIYVDGLDSNFSNDNICWFGDAMVFRGSGHIVSNTHFTIHAFIQSRLDSDGVTRSYWTDYEGTPLTQLPDKANVLIDPCIARSISGWNSFCNCYFNAGKYVVKYAPKASVGTGYSMCTDIVGGSYLLKADKVYLSAQNETLPNMDQIEVFLFAGPYEENVHFSNFNVWCPDRYVVRDYFADGGYSDWFITQIKFDMVRNGLPLEPLDIGGPNILCAGNLMPSGHGEPVMTSSASHPIASGKYGRIASVFIRRPTIYGTTLFDISPIKIRFNNRNYREEDVTITLNASTGIWAARTEFSGNYSSSTTTMFIDNMPNYVTIRGKTYVYYNIYLGNPSTSMNAVTFTTMYSTSSMVSVYMHQSPYAIASDLRTTPPGSSDTVIF